MMIPEARNYLGRDCTVTFRDRRGDVQTKIVHVADVMFIPMYGACLVGDREDIWLDRVTNIAALD